MTTKQQEDWFNHSIGEHHLEMDEFHRIPNYHRMVDSPERNAAITQMEAHDKKWGSRNAKRKAEGLRIDAVAERNETATSIGFIVLLSVVLCVLFVAWLSFQ